MNKPPPRPAFEFANHLTMMWRQIAVMRARARINQEAIARSAEAIAHSRDLLNAVDVGAATSASTPEGITEGPPAPG